MQYEGHDLLNNFIDGYIKNVVEGFESRWNTITPDIYNNHIHESIGSLISRQATLSIEFISAPSTWNGHVAPLFLRCMVDAYITLAWILENPKDRSIQYIHYGLGQEKLFIEYLENEYKEDESIENIESVKEMIKIRKDWLNQQLHEWAVEINVGSWSGMNTREMAKEIGRESIYKYAYVPFSGTTHNMWQHVAIFNMKKCQNPLHKFHLVPSILKAPIAPDFVFNSAKYISITYELCDNKLGTKSDIILPLDFCDQHELFFKK